MAKPLPLALALSLLAAAPAAAQHEDKLPTALMVEWTLANCKADDLPAMLVAFSSIIIEAAPEADVERLRGLIREGVKENYPSPAEACADFRESMLNP